MEKFIYIFSGVPLHTRDDKTSGTVMELMKDTQYSLWTPTFDKGQYNETINCNPLWRNIRCLTTQMF